MEASLAQDPRPDHPIDGWFEPAVTARLTAAGLTTIADLIGFIEARRHRWYAAIPRLGPKGAQRIVDWLQLHAQALEHTLSPLALLPRRQWRPEHAAIARNSAALESNEIVVAPLEALRVPAALDGSKGSNRAGANARFDTDSRAIFAWLDARSASEHTRRAYRREAERLLLWSLVEKGKPLSSLDGRECAEYIDTFLPNPQPAGSALNAASGIFPAGVRSRVRCRIAAGKRPVPSSARCACEWLVGQAYLASNPFSGVARAAAPPVFDATDRTLDLQQWQHAFQLVTRERAHFRSIVTDWRCSSPTPPACAVPNWPPRPPTR